MNVSNRLNVLSIDRLSILSIAIVVRLKCQSKSQGTRTRGFLETLTASTRPKGTEETFAPLTPSKDKRRLRDTKVGAWLTTKAPAILDAVGDVLPDSGVLGVVKNLVDMEPNMSAEDRLELERLVTSERVALEAERTKRWEADANSDSWLSKNTRPLIVLSLVGVLFVFIVLDSLDIALEVRDSWVTLYEVLIVTAVGGYFTLRSVFDKRPPHP